MLKFIFTYCLLKISVYICTHITIIINMTKQPKTKVYPIRLETQLLNEAHQFIEPSELRLKIKKKINNYLKTIK